MVQGARICLRYSADDALTLGVMAPPWGVYCDQMAEDGVPGSQYEAEFLKR